MNAAISPNHVIEGINNEEGRDLEMEDAINEEERDIIRRDRAETKLRDSPFTRHLNEEMDNITLHELACKPCDEDKEEEETEEADKPKQIWKPSGPQLKKLKNTT